VKEQVEVCLSNSALTQQSRLGQRKKIMHPFIKLMTHNIMTKNVCFPTKCKKKFVFASFCKTWVGPNVWSRPYKKMQKETYETTKLTRKEAELRNTLWRKVVHKQYFSV